MTIALITGAAHRLGLEVARQLAQTGVRVLIAARDADRAAQAARGVEGVEGVGEVAALPVGLDVSDTASVRQAAERVTADPGALDILINNAAVPPDHVETAVDTDLARAAEVLDVDLFGAWRMTQAFLPLLRRSDHPRIVNVGSGAGSHTDPQYGMPVMGGAGATHAVAKAALHAFTDVLAAGLADTPVIVNAVCPGVTGELPRDADLVARPASQSAPGVVWAATLPDDGPRGGFFRDGRTLGW